MSNIQNGLVKHVALIYEVLDRAAAEGAGNHRFEAFGREAAGSPSEQPLRLSPGRIWSSDDLNLVAEPMRRPRLSAVGRRAKPTITWPQFNAFMA